MRVLLLYPEFPNTFWGFRHALKFVGKKASVPPLGLLTVAALLPPEWEKRLVDTNVRRLEDADIEWAEVVFLGAMIAQRKSAHELAARCHAAGKVVVAGGPLFGAEHAQFPGVDYFVLGEAENTLAPFLEDFAVGRAKRLYSSTEFPDIRHSPAPLWQLADLRRYASMNIQFSRGCPFDCDFCNITAMLGHRPRVKTAAQVLAELDALVRLGWRGEVFFVDDNLIGNKRYLKEELLPALIHWRRDKPPITFYTQASINLADDAELMRLMAEAGFDTVFIGIETPEEAGLTECNKRQNCGRDMVADVKRMQRAGLQVQGGFIVGFDSDTPSIFQRQLEFIEKSGIVTAMVGLLNAVPDTRLYRRLQEEGRLTGTMTGDNVDGTTNIVTKMDFASLHEGYRQMMKRLYAPREYYRRVRTLMREFKPVRMKPSLTPSNLRAFADSCFRLGVVGRERFHFWGLLVWTLCRRPRLFELAVRSAIYGYHFRKTCGSIQVAPLLDRRDPLRGFPGQDHREPVG